MNEDAEDSVPSVLELRSRRLFQNSVAGIDMRRCSRLTQARHGALEAAALRGARPWFFRTGYWTPAAGAAAAALLAAALWVGNATGTHEFGDGQTNLDDLDIVASSDTTPGDAIEMLQDDIDFYDFAEKAVVAGPAV